MTDILFVDRVAPSIAVKPGVDGRAMVSVDVVLTADGATATPVDRTVSVPIQFPGPGDTRGLSSSAVRQTYPPDGADAVEVRVLPHVELVAPDLPWRYALADKVAWLGLLVGVADTELSLFTDESGLRVGVTDELLAAIRRSVRHGAHASSAEGEDVATKGVARIVSQRPLPAASSCVGVVVQGLANDGGDWPNGTTSVPALFVWRFQTGAGDDFVRMASRLRSRAIAGIGTSDLDLSAVSDAWQGHLQSALVAIGTAGQVETMAEADLNRVAALSEEPSTARRPVLGLPDYLLPWREPATNGGAAVAEAQYDSELRRDPRSRVPAGLGAADGVRDQESLVGAYLDQAGAIETANGRIASLSLGAETARSLWARRIPADAAGRLAVLGPALGNIADSDLRALTAALPITSGARRALRARSASEVSIGAGALVRAAAERPVELDHAPVAAGFLSSLKANPDRPPLPTGWLGEPERQSPLGLDMLAKIAASIADAFDPSDPTDGPQRRRVLSGIDGLDAEPDKEQETCEVLDLAAWRYLRDWHGDFLLHGAGQIPEDSIVGLEVNDAFVDAYLTGLNAQLVAELRFRNVPVSGRCTPIRRFWDRAEATGAAHETSDDILGIADWPSDSALGDPRHRPSEALGGGAHRLVVVFRTMLFRRFPRTLVSLRRKSDQARIWPSFVGDIASDTVFFGFPIESSALQPPDGGDLELLIEEPSHALRFFDRSRFDENAPATPTTGGAWAAWALDLPHQVVIDGAYLYRGEP